MRKNKTMKGGWIDGTRNFIGQLAKINSKPQQRAVPDLNLVGQAKKITSNPQRGATFMNPQKVNMAQNVFGSARGMFDRFNNRQPDGVSKPMTWVERGEQAQKLIKNFGDNPFVKFAANTGAANKALNKISNSSAANSFNEGIINFSRGRRR